MTNKFISNIEKIITNYPNYGIALTLDNQEWNEFYQTNYLYELEEEPIEKLKNKKIRASVFSANEKYEKIFYQGIIENNLLEEYINEIKFYDFYYDTKVNLKNPISFQEYLKEIEKEIKLENIPLLTNELIDTREIIFPNLKNEERKELFEVKNKTILISGCRYKFGDKDYCYDLECNIAILKIENNICRWIIDYSGTNRVSSFYLFPFKNK